MGEASWERKQKILPQKKTVEKTSDEGENNRDNTMDQALEETT